MESIEGFLFMRLERVGTRSEGPEYFLQRFDENPDLHIRKNVAPWQDEPALRKYLAMKVTITGVVQNSEMAYSSIVALKPAGPPPTDRSARLSDPVVEAGPNWHAWLNTMPMSPRTLHVVGEVQLLTEGITAELTRVEPQGFNPTILLLQVDTQPLKAGSGPARGSDTGRTQRLSYVEEPGGNYAEVQVICQKGGGFPVTIPVEIVR